LLPDPGGSLQRNYAYCIFKGPTSKGRREEEGKKKEGEVQVKEREGGRR